MLLFVQAYIQVLNTQQYLGWATVWPQ